MRVLVTGGRGLLGGSLARALIARGDDVTVLQRHPSSLPCREVLADIADRTTVADAVRGQDAVLHLAAVVDVTGRWAHFARTNVEGTRHVVDAARHHGVRRLVHVSSPSVAHAGAALVGAGAGPADPRRARGHYARSKALAELVALRADSPDLAVTAVRPHLVWGPGDTQLVGRILERARAGRLLLVGTGAALVDTTYVENAVDALLAALDRCHLLGGTAHVVTNGEPRTLAELVARICAAAGAPAPRHHLPVPLARGAGAALDAVWALARPAGEPPMTRFLAEQLSTAHWFDQRRTRAALAWEPRVSLAEGFARLSEVHRPSRSVGSPQLSAHP